jgi:hypothetical protein
MFDIMCVLFLNMECLTRALQRHMMPIASSLWFLGNVITCCYFRRAVAEHGVLGEAVAEAYDAFRKHQLSTCI